MRGRNREWEREREREREREGGGEEKTRKDGVKEVLNFMARVLRDRDIK